MVGQNTNYHTNLYTLDDKAVDVDIAGVRINTKVADILIKFDMGVSM